MITLELLVEATGAEVVVGGARPTFPGFALDSRTLNSGECFVAVNGIQNDGHDFVRHAAASGAGAVLVARSRWEARTASAPDLLEDLREAGTWVLAVPDTRAALRQYAAAVLAAWRPMVIAVAGSVGKTTTKEALADVLSTLAPTYRSWRNYNDLLGLPTSLGRLAPEHRFAVLELGADYPGEMRKLCSLIHPTVGIITATGAAHLDYFGTEQRFAAEVGELLKALPADGLAVLNAADAGARALAERTRAPVRYFAPVEDAPGDVPLALRYTRVPLGSREPLALALVPAEASDAEPLVFPHLLAESWAAAVLAAATAGVALGVPEERAFAALRTLEPLPGRMRRLEGVDGQLLLDDSHNAVPASAQAGLAALTAIARARGTARVAILGDMLRLGERSAVEHQRLGRAAAASADYLVLRGQQSETVATAAREAGMPASAIALTHTAEDAAQAARTFANTREQGATFYIKGSEELRMEQVTARLLAHPEQREAVLDRQTQAWRRIVVTRPDRPTWLEIDLNAIAQNTRRLKARVGAGVRVLVSLKADAYGHGAVRVARTVLHNGAEWLGVATVSEARVLRTAGIEAPILVFGYTAPWQAREAVRLDLRATVYSQETARALAQAASDLGRAVRVHLKVDTGMARLGLRAEDPAAVADFVAEVRRLPGLELEGVFTHFATADSADQTYARRQLARFHAVLEALEARGLRPPLVHASNSAALLTLPEAHFAMVRPGIAVYGLAPSQEVPLPQGFLPALAFKTQVAQVKEIPAGEGISYGATYVTERPTRIAVLPVGYADGFRRAPSTWGEVLLRGMRAPLLGRVTMDQCMIDVTAIPGVQPGDEVVLLGRQGQDELTAEEVATRLGTIAYEVVAALLARVPRLSEA